MSTVHIQLGRNGDLILLLPCWRKIAELTGQKPVVIVARDFSPVLLGASFVEPDIINAHWYANVHLAAQMAHLKYGERDCEIVITQCHGVGHATDQSLQRSFGEAMWAKAGFGGQYGTLPMVFDRRNPEREARLIHPYAGKKPFVLFNFSGRSSPLPCDQEVRQRLRRYERKYCMVNLGAIRAERIYDLLGLYDLAAGLVSIDTATLHLAAASKVPLLAYCRGDWSGAVPKPGATRVNYAEAHLKLDVVDAFLESLPAC